MKQAQTITKNGIVKHENTVQGFAEFQQSKPKCIGIKTHCMEIELP